MVVRPEIHLPWRKAVIWIRVGKAVFDCAVESLTDRIDPLDRRMGGAGEVVGMTNVPPHSLDRLPRPPFAFRIGEVRPAPGRGHAQCDRWRTGSEHFREAS